MLSLHVYVKHSVYEQTELLRNNRSCKMELKKERIIVISKKQQQ